MVNLCGTVVTRKTEQATVYFDRKDKSLFDVETDSIEIETEFNKYTTIFDAIRNGWSVK